MACYRRLSFVHALWGRRPSYCPMVRFMVPHLISSGFVQWATENTQRLWWLSSRRREATAPNLLFCSPSHPAVWGGAPGMQLPDAGLRGSGEHAKFLLFPLSTRVFHSYLTNDIVMGHIICSSGPQLSFQQPRINLALGFGSAGRDLKYSTPRHLMRPSWRKWLKNEI